MLTWFTKAIHLDWSCLMIWSCCVCYDVSDFHQKRMAYKLNVGGAGYYSRQMNGFFHMVLFILHLFSVLDIFFCFVCEHDNLRMAKRIATKLFSHNMLSKMAIIEPCAGDLCERKPAVFVWLNTGKL